MKDYAVKHNDCRLCIYGRKPRLWERIVKKWTLTEYAAVCTSESNDMAGRYPITHYDNQWLPCRMYAKKG